MTHWLTTAPDPRSSPRGYDCGQKGWRLHAVEAPEGATFTSVRDVRALCGVRPAHGWSLDLFIERRCARCERLAGLPPSPENTFAAQLRREWRRR